MMPIAYQLKVYGIVQGVFFRKHTRDKAEELGITGTVQNCEDGTVEIFAVGDEAIINLFIEWCRSGPPRAKVERIDIHERAVKNYSNFVIIH